MLLSLSGYCLSRTIIILNLETECSQDCKYQLHGLSIAAFLFFFLFLIFQNWLKPFISVCFPSTFWWGRSRWKNSLIIFTFAATQRKRWEALSFFFFSEGGAEICRKEFPAHSPNTLSHIICKYYLAFKVFKGCFSVSVSSSIWDSAHQDEHQWEQDAAPKTLLYLFCQLYSSSLQGIGSVAGWVHTALAVCLVLGHIQTGSRHHPTGPKPRCADIVMGISGNERGIRTDTLGGSQVPSD